MGPRWLTSYKLAETDRSARTGGLGKWPKMMEGSSEINYEGAKVTENDGRDIKNLVLGVRQPSQLSQLSHRKRR